MLDSRSFEIQVGTDSKNTLLSTLVNSGYRISSRALDIIIGDDFVIKGKKKVTVKVMVTGRLAVNGGNIPNMKSLYSRNRELGGGLCPDEIAPRLLLFLNSEEKKPSPRIFNENYYVAMNPIRDKQGYRCIFQIHERETTRFNEHDPPNPILENYYELGAIDIPPDWEWIRSNRIICTLP